MIMGSLFNFNLRKQNHSSPNLAQKYHTVAKMLKERKTVVEEKPTSKAYHFKLRETDGFQTFTFTEVDDRLIIVWKLESVMHGKRGKEWSFSQQYDQMNIFKEIMDDISRYIRTLFRETR